MERLLLSPDQVAESLGVCRSRVYDLMRTRVLPSVKIGRARRCRSVRSGPTSINSLTPGTCLERPRERKGFCLSSPRWAIVGCRVCASPGRRASPSTGVRADACRGQREVDGSAVQDGGGDPIGGGDVDGRSYADHWLETVARARLRPATWTNYSYAVRVHIGPSLGSVRLRALTPAPSSFLG